MALVEIARVDDLAEAEIVRGALAAAGFNPALFEQSSAYNMQSRSEGARIMVPAEEAGDAKAFLAEVGPAQASSGQIALDDSPAGFVRHWISSLKWILSTPALAIQRRNPLYLIFGLSLAVVYLFLSFVVVGLMYRGAAAIVGMIAALFQR